MERERPILFTGEMVRAILAGTKTRTRRVIQKRIRGDVRHIGPRGTDDDPSEWGFGDAHGRWWVLGRGHSDGDMYCGTNSIPCPCGEPGDLLWVREKQRVIEVGLAGCEIQDIRVRYEADGTESGWITYPERLKGTPVVGKCLAYGGYRESSRLTLRVTDVRVERVQDISEEDAKAEGTPSKLGRDYITPCDFRELWDSINGKRPGCSWAENPWVWVVAFERVEQP